MIVERLALWQILPCAAGLVLFSTPNSVNAQIIPDQTLSITERSLISGTSILQIDGGAIRGSNLFHSFQEFSIPTGSTAYFNNAPAITTIISRVTGAAPSNIDGVIRANGTANVFLVNPNGIVFGRNAGLNIGGSFLATTATAVQFGTQGSFSAIAPKSPDLLTIDPSALLLNQLTAQAIRSQANLEVSPGRSLSLVSNSISLESATLQAPGGRIEMLGIAGLGTVGINLSGATFSLSVPPSIALADVSLSQGSEVTVRAGGLGSIAIHSQNLTLSTGSRLRAGIAANSGFPGSQAGDIDIYASGTVTLADGSFIANSTLGTGNSGNVKISAQSVSLLQGAQVNASTFGLGNGGNVTIDATGLVQFEGENSAGVSSGTYSQVNAGAVGNSGGIMIRAGSVRVADGALLTATTRGRGNAGSVTIVAQDAVQFSGVGAVDLYPSGAYSGVRSGAIGDSGGIDIQARSLAVENGAQLDASTYSQGNSGRITIQTAGAVKLGGALPAGVDDPGGIYSFVGERGIGNSGGISLRAGSLSMENGAAAVATTFGRGNAGNVLIQVADSVVLDGQSPLFSTGLFSSVSPIATGNGGDIQLTAGSLALTNGAAIAASTLGQGNAANITLGIAGSATFDGVGRDGFPSGIFSRVGAGAVGNSGDIRVSAQSLALTNGGQLQASTKGQGNAGSIQIQTQDRTLLAGMNAETGLNSGIFSTTTPTSTGSGGGITVRAGILEFQPGGAISSASQGTGRSGNIVLTVRDRLQAQGGQISTSSTQSTGGAISATAKTIRLADNSDITTSVFRGEGGSGNITLTARAIIALDDSDILAFSRDGSGGNITLNTPVFFGFRYQSAASGIDPAILNGNGRVDINASGRLANGSITLPAIIPLQNSLAALPDNLVDTNALIASSCIARREVRQGRLLITGTGGLPPQPDDLANSPFPTYQLMPVTAETEPRSRHSPAIIEIDGIYPLRNGALILGRQCD